MKKVVIVDDDQIVRAYIRSVLQTAAEEFVLVGEAANGTRGLQLIEQLRPDMAILDMEMPSMDGIELLNTLEQRHISLCVLILSCHDEFEYVRQAMKLGAADYLLKHKADDEAILAALRNLRDRPPTVETPVIADSQQRAQQLVRLVSGALLQRDVKKAVATLSCEGRSVVLCAAEIDYLQDYKKKQGEQAAQQLEERVWQQMQAAPVAGCEYTLFRVDSGSYGMLLSFDNLPISQLETRRRLYYIMTADIAQIAESCGVTITVGISERQSGADLVQVQWIRARMAVAHKFYAGCGKSIFYEDLPVCGEKDESLQLLLDGLRSRVMNREEMLLAVRELFEQFSTAYLVREEFQHLFYTLLSVLTSMLSRMNLEIEQVFVRFHFNRETLETLGDYRDWSIDAINAIFDAAQNASQGGVRSEITSSLAYIESNYASEIALEDVARHVCVSKTYFSSMFKKETGQTFSLYLIEYRLKKAQELLKHGDRKIYNVAYDVGFQSHNYFNNIFKEHFGTTPREYRLQYRKKIEDG